MAKIVEDRQCKACGQIIQSAVKPVHIFFLGRKIPFHPGCARLISESFNEWIKENAISGKIGGIETRIIKKDAIGSV